MTQFVKGHFQKMESKKMQAKMNMFQELYWWVEHKTEVHKTVGN